MQLPRSIFCSQFSIILCHSYPQLIHPQISPDYRPNRAQCFSLQRCANRDLSSCLAARLEHPEAKRMNPQRRLMLPDQKPRQRKNKPKVALAKDRKRKLFLPPPTSKYIYSAHERVEHSRTDRASARIDGRMQVNLLSRTEASFVCTWRKEPKKPSRSETKAAMPHGVKTNELCVHPRSFYCKMPKKVLFFHALAPSITFLVYLFYPLQDQPTEKQKRPLSRLEGTSVVLGGEDEDPVQRPGHHLHGAQLAISLALGMLSDPFDQYEVIDM